MAKAVLKRIGQVLLALVLVASGLWATSRLLYPTAEQREAIALMQDLAQPEGTNAFSALITLGHRVPEDDIPRLIETERQRFGEWFEQMDPFQPQVEAYRSALDDYPEISPDERDRELLCPSGLDDCLQRVRENPEAYRGLVERNREWLDGIESIAHHDHYRTAMPGNWLAPMPAFNPLFHLRTRHALMFIDGRVDDALAATCNQIAGWRGLSSNADSLIIQLVGQSLVQKHGRMLVEMAAELPLEQPLPEACGTALLPPRPGELSLCNAMRSEFEMIESVPIPQTVQNPALSDRLGNLVFSLGYDEQATLGEQAQLLAVHCSATEIADIGADRRVTDRQEPAGMFRFACAGNWFGCALAQLAAPAWLPYRQRTRDHGARLRLLNAWFNAREQANGNPEQMLQLLAGRLDELSHSDRRYALDRQTNEIRVELYAPERDAHWRLPLPRPGNMNEGLTSESTATMPLAYLPRHRPDLAVRTKSMRPRLSGFENVVGIMATCPNNNRPSNNPLKKQRS